MASNVIQIDGGVLEGVCAIYSFIWKCVLQPEKYVNWGLKGPAIQRCAAPGILGPLPHPSSECGQTSTSWRLLTRVASASTAKNDVTLTREPNANTNVIAELCYVVVSCYSGPLHIGLGLMFAIWYNHVCGTSAASAVFRDTHHVSYRCKMYT